VHDADRFLAGVEIQPRPLFSLRCRPSIFTTARTGPDCSTVTFSTWLENFSRAGALSASPSGPFCRMPTSRPSRAISRPPIVSESIKLTPPLEIFACTRPVSISTTPADWFTVSFGASDIAPLPVCGASLNGPACSGPATVAKPLHFKDPSGQ
jgi:hypothetical protein